MEHNRRKLAENQANQPSAYQSALPIRSRFAFDLDDARRLLQERLIGQSEVLEQLLDALSYIKSDFADADRPLWNALLIEPTGVGKTEAAKLLAKVLTGSDDNLCRIDMNTLSQSHYSAAITGAPPGYVGSKEGVTLFDERLIAGDLARPGVVLFDEIEKASDEVRMALLNVLEDGYLTLAGSGKRISFRNSIILMTSNLGARLWESTHGGRVARALGLQRRRQKRVLNAITQGFAPEFFNRIDRVLMFASLSDTAAGDILMLELERLNQRLQRKGISMTLSADVCQQLVREGFSSRYGARSVRRIVRDRVEMPLACFLIGCSALRHERGDLVVHGVWEDNAVQFQF
ncbi:AAA family ATPase [Gilvimarinus sp. SDUM040013]|uniref:AAA family ATPase n=1 Tax=Gilvimarinus gilvus TaxID=3058038 RepID=A0ABU4RT18_9GAMM|nr:AAA family ATPase [Gilvimarinus sp. SDUM040013]MDO3387076.1 AAA family ATPase [Gilvimarinus sp. SDUM040013]MDX6848030.1 AAA family ATPase [Gilvimarinus sp. SDUM040013]